jgi:hypothetical protein
VAHESDEIRALDQRAGLPTTAARSITSFKAILSGGASSSADLVRQILSGVIIADGFCLIDFSPPAIPDRTTIAVRNPLLVWPGQCALMSEQGLACVGSALGPSACRVRLEPCM